MDRTCLITGVAGFIGSHTARLLLEKGYVIYGIDALLPYYDVAIKQHNIKDLSQHPNFHFYQENILSFQFEQLPVKLDYIIHLAASPGVRFSSQRTQEYIDNNITASIRILDYAKGQAFRKIILASTSSIYDDKGELPYSEHSNLDPKAVYGISKLCMERISNIYRQEHDLPIMTLRYFSVYGPGQRPDMGIHLFMDKTRKGETISIYGDGNQTRDFTYIEDVAQANWQALESETLQGIYNIASGRSITINSILDKIFRVVGNTTTIRYVPILKEESLHTLGNISKARKDLGYAPSTHLETGLRKQWEWMVDSEYKLG